MQCTIHICVRVCYTTFSGEQQFYDTVLLYFIALTEFLLLPKLAVYARSVHLIRSLVVMVVAVVKKAHHQFVVRTFYHITSFTFFYFCVLFTFYLLYYPVSLILASRPASFISQSMIPFSLAIFITFTLHCNNINNRRHIVYTITVDGRFVDVRFFY